MLPVYVFPFVKIEEMRIQSKLASPFVETEETHVHKTRPLVETEET
jgi:hypothetical protein